MRIRKIPKGGGRFRTIYVPNTKEKERLRKLLPLLHQIHQQAIEQHGTRGVCHAFMPNRNPVTCALPHRGFQVTVSCDLENWFDTVTDKHLLTAGVPPEIVEAITLPDEQGVRRCRQGLPTSPVAANIAAVAFDRYLIESFKNIFHSGRYAFTRYADDLTVSFDEPLNVPFVQYVIRFACNLSGWTIADHKTHIQHAKAGRRIIVGIAVDERVQATRKTRRKLRAARHQAQGKIYHNGKHIGGVVNPKAVNSADGIAEWAACKLPRRARSTRQLMGVLAGSGPVAASPNNAVTVAVSGSGRRVLIEKIADDSANQ